jgi:hypothetical protein
MSGAARLKLAVHYGAATGPSPDIHHTRHGPPTVTAQAILTQ